MATEERGSQSISPVGNLARVALLSPLNRMGQRPCTPDQHQIPVPVAMKVGVLRRAAGAEGEHEALA